MSKQSTYNLMWAIAILREDMQKCWLEIAAEIGLSVCKCRSLYARVKKDYNFTCSRDTS